MKTIKHENFEIAYSFRIPNDEHREYVANLVKSFGAHWIEHHNNKYNWGCDAVQICKQDSRGALSITLLRGSEHVNQAWHGYTAKELIKFMQGFIYDKPFIS